MPGLALDFASLATLIAQGQLQARARFPARPYILGSSETKGRDMSTNNKTTKKPKRYGSETGAGASE